MSRRRHGIAVAAIALASLACGPATAFECESDEQCVRPRWSGTCEPLGYCSFPDGGCASGRRYGEHAGAGVAAQCVEPDHDPGSEEDDGDDVDDDAGSTSPAPEGSTTDASTTDPDFPAAESSGGEAPLDTGGVDDDAGSTSDAATGGTSVGAEETTTGADPLGCATSLLDDFEDGAIDPAWTKNIKPGGSIAESGGELRVTIAAGQGSNSIVSQPLDDLLLGGWALLRISSLASPGSSALSGLVVGVGGCDLQIYVHEGVVRAVRYAADAIPTAVQLDWASLPRDLPLWLRIRLDDDGAHFELSTDAMTWTLVASDPVPECDLDGTPVVGMIAGASPSSALTRTFDEISVCMP